MRTTARFLAAFLLLAVPAAAKDFLQELGDALKDGDVHLEFELQPGRVPVNSSWGLEVRGAPRAEIAATALDGRLGKISMKIRDGDLFLAGRGLFPNVFIDELEGTAEQGIVAARFHGRGFGNCILALFRGTAMSRVRKLRFQSELSSLFRGEFLVAEKGTRSPRGPGAAQSPPAPRESPPPTAAPSTGTATVRFSDLFRSIKIRESKLTAFPGRRLTFGTGFWFDTADDLENGASFQVLIDTLFYRFASRTEPSELQFDGTIDGSASRGRLGVGGEILNFNRARTSAGHLEIVDGPGGNKTVMSARQLSLEIISGRFPIPGGPAVELREGSRFLARGFRFDKDGRFSGVIDVDLAGDTGEWKQANTRVALSDVTLHAELLEFKESRATGRVDLQFNYRLKYPFVVHYPMPGLSDRPVILDFAGPLEAHLDLADSGPGGTGRAGGSFSLKLPWKPIEKAAFEAIRARWRQDLPPLFRNVDFEIEPSRFGPCGGSCFQAQFHFLAGRPEKGALFREACEPQGKGDLVVDGATGSIRLHNLAFSTHCEGVAGKILNLIAPLLARSYQDLTVLQLPADSPFRVGKVQSGVDWLQVSGTIAWAPTRREPAASTEPKTKKS
jgi:hypothetical protein